MLTRTFAILGLVLVLGFESGASAMAADSLDIDTGSLAHRYFKSLESCRDTLEGCTQQQELALAQTKGAVLDSKQLGEYLAQNPDQGYFIPLSLNDQELLTLAAGTSAGIVAFANDQEIMDTVQAHKMSVTAQIASVGNFFGSHSMLPIAAGSYFFGVVYKDDKLEKAGLFMIGASVASSLVVRAAKKAFGGAPPRVGVGPDGFGNANEASFFSGHTTEAFTIATVFSELFKEDYPVVPWLAYGAATVTAYAHMHGKAHWASDVIVGGIAGHLITKLLIDGMSGTPDGRDGLQIHPSFDPTVGSMTVNFEWTLDPHEPPACAKIQNPDERLQACIEEAFDAGS